MISVQKVVMDNEKAVVSALRTHYDGVDINLCLFHLHQSFFKRIKANGLYTVWKKNNNFQKMVKSILTLTFLPQNKFLNYYGDIEANLINLEGNLNIEAFTSWMRTNFVDNYQYKKYINFERLHHGTPLTSKCAESNFLRLNTYFNSANPSLTTFSKNILRIHQNTGETIKRSPTWRG